MSITTSSAYVRVTSNGITEDFHPGCAVSYADNQGVDTGSLTREAGVEDIARGLGGSPTLPERVTVNIVRPYGEALGYCAHCGESLGSDQPEPEGGVIDFTPGEVTLDPETGTFERYQVRYNGTTYTVDQALAYAESQGYTKPDYMTLEQAAQWAREMGYDVELVTIDSTTEETIDFGEIPEDFTLQDEPEDEDKYYAYYRVAVAQALCHALRRDDAWDVAFTKGAAHVAARLMGLDTERYDWETFVTTVVALTEQD